MVLTMFSDAMMANLQDDSPDLHIADAPRARTIGIRASARIFDPSRKVTAAKIPAFSNSRPLSAIDFGHGRRQSCCCCFICWWFEGWGKIVYCWWLRFTIERHGTCSTERWSPVDGLQHPIDNREVYAICCVSRNRWYVYELYQSILSWLFQSSVPHHKSTQYFVLCNMTKAFAAPWLTAKSVAANEGSVWVITIRSIGHSYLPLQVDPQHSGKAQHHSRP